MKLFLIHWYSFINIKLCSMLPADFLNRNYLKIVTNALDKLPGRHGDDAYSHLDKGAFFMVLYVPIHLYSGCFKTLCKHSEQTKHWASSKGSAQNHVIMTTKMEKSSRWLHQWHQMTLTALRFCYWSLSVITE